MTTQNTTQNTRRNYGFRIDRGGSVYAFHTAATHGRVPKHAETLIGYVWKIGKTWRNDQCCDEFRTQEDAATMLMRIVWRVA